MPDATTVPGLIKSRVIGTFKDPRYWLRLCADSGVVPDVLFSVGRDYIVATADNRSLFIRRGPEGPRAVSHDPRLLSMSLHRKVASRLNRILTDTSLPVTLVGWRLPPGIKRAEKNDNPVS